MQAVILASNEKERFQQLGTALVVPMLPIADRPVVSLAVELLAKNGLRNILVSTYHSGEYIEGYLGSGRRWGVNFTYARHRQQFGTAGALKRSEGLLKETFVAVSADAITMVDLSAALAQHHARQSAVTVVVHACDKTYAGARVLTNASGRVTACGRNLPEDVLRNAGVALAGTGVFIIEPSILPLIPGATITAIDEDLVPALLMQEQAVDVFVTEGYWNPLASLADYDAAQHAFLQSAWQPGLDAAIPGYTINASQIAPGVWIGRNHAIHPTVKIAPPIFVADNCYIGKDVELGPYAVLAENTIIDDEATVANSTILAGTYVGRLVKVEGRVVNKTVIADPATGEATQVVDAFLLSETRPAVTPDIFRRYLDALFALLALVVTLPLTLLIGLAVLLTSGGRLIRRLPRVTGHTAEDASSAPYRPFDLLRFETRRRDGDRFTAIGRWLEHWEWNRFPELWNVIRGDLRWVGVKPLTPQEAAQVAEEWQTRRFTCPSGLTGLWYVQSGLAQDMDSILDETLIADAYYVATRNLREDIRLLWRTPAAWARRLRSVSPVAPALV